MNGYRKDRWWSSLGSTQMIVFSFLTIIATGTVLLLLPWATQGRSLNFIDALFTAVSATCVTGLTVINIGSEFTIYGQVVVLTLIQLGGLGIMTFSTFFIYLLGRRVSIRGREIMDSTLSYSPVPNIGSLLRKIMAVVFLVECAGGILLTFHWLGMYGFPKAVYYGFFHAVSAFCNAGFSLYKDSFEGFRSDTVVNGVIMGLIVIGGLGFVVLLDFKNLFRRRKRMPNRFSFHSKVVLSVTGFLLLLGTLFIFLVERPHTLEGIEPATGFLMALFQSVTARTAGFNTMHIEALSNAACLLMMFLMFFGAAPGSCGGGVKVTTLGILFAMFVSRFRGEEEPTIFFRSIPRETVTKAVSIVLSAIIIIFTVFLFLLLTEDWTLSPDASRGHFLKLLFESISAFGTVGLSMGATSQLTKVGRLLIIVLMFVGRLGPLTMAVALARKKVGGRFRYAKGEIMVG